jgi:hypothetical protein
MVVATNMWLLPANAEISTRHSHALTPSHSRPGNDVTLPREAVMTMATLAKGRDSGVLARLRKTHRDGRVGVRKTTRLRAGRFSTSLPWIILMADHA